MARTKRSERDVSRGERFRAVCQRLFPGRPRAFVAERLGGVSGGSIRNWELGQSISPEALTLLERLGVSMDYLLRGEGEQMLPPADMAAVTAPVPSDADDPKYLARVMGANLKHLRKQRFSGWGGQKKFADFLGISANDLCVYEYGRGLPNEQRLAAIALKVELTPEQLRQPLPGVVVPPPPAPVDRTGYLSGQAAGTDAALRERVDDLKRQVARLEGRLEASQEQIVRQQEQIRKLQEANYALRHLLYVNDSPDSQRRRERLLESLEPTIAELTKWNEVF